jgi:hypothetical protein
MAGPWFRPGQTNLGISSYLQLIKKWAAVPADSWKIPHLRKALPVTCHLNEPSKIHIDTFQKQHSNSGQI